MERTYKKEKEGARPQIQKKMYWLLGRKYQLSVHNKLMLYKQVLKPNWTYGIQLWGCAATSNINKIQVLQNSTARYCGCPMVLSQRSSSQRSKNTND
jgi:hypothetical protein